MENDIKTAIEYGKFTVQARQEFQKNYREEIIQLFQYAQVLMSILGLIAGFGFTAFGYVKSQTLFFVGETFVVGSILYLVFKVKGYMAGQPMSTEKYMNSYGEKSREIKTALKEKDKDKIAGLAKEFNEGVNDVSPAPKIETANIVSSSLEYSFWFSMVGILLIFLSFFVCF